MTPIFNRKQSPLVRIFSSRLFRKRRKVFVVGLNKTGTTSMAVALRELGYRVGKQEEAELFLDEWAKGNHQPVLDHCLSADAFQDIPFTLPGAWRVMDDAFPNSRFILTVRADAKEWFESLTRFHTKIIGNGRLPTAKDLMESGYRAPGWTWRAHKLAFNVDESKLYQFEHYRDHYDTHNREVREHFRDRPDDFLELNLSEPDAGARLCRFLGLRERFQTMPHVNRSKS